MKTLSPIALVLPGGGFRGAYQAGVITELAKSGIHFDIIAGASVGSCNGAALAVGLAERLGELWEQAVTRGIFQPKLLLRGKNPFSISQVLRQFADEYGSEDLLEERSDIDFLVSVTDATNVQNHVISLKDTSWTHQERVNFYLASSSIPILCQRIEIRGRWYVDGGITNNCPIEAAIERGAKEVWVVDMGDFPSWERKALHSFGKFLQIFPNPKSSSIKLFKSLFVPSDPISDHDFVVIHRISPSRPLNIGQLHLTQKKVRETVYLGIHDTKNFLEQYQIREPNILT